MGSGQARGVCGLVTSVAPDRMNMHVLVTATAPNHIDLYGLVISMAQNHILLSLKQAFYILVFRLEPRNGHETAL